MLLEKNITLNTPTAIKQLIIIKLQPRTPDKAKKNQL